MRLRALWEAAAAGMGAARTVIEAERRAEKLAEERHRRNQDLSSLLRDIQDWLCWLETHGGRPVPWSKQAEARGLVRRLELWGCARPPDGEGPPPRTMGSRRPQPALPESDPPPPALPAPTSSPPPAGSLRAPPGPAPAPRRGRPPKLP